MFQERQTGARQAAASEIYRDNCLIGTIAVDRYLAFRFADRGDGLLCRVVWFEPG
jgi:hypothetical protein